MEKKQTKRIRTRGKGFSAMPANGKSHMIFCNIRTKEQPFGRSSSRHTDRAPASAREGSKDRFACFAILFGWIIPFCLRNVNTKAEFLRPFCMTLLPKQNPKKFLRIWIKAIVSAFEKPECAVLGVRLWRPYFFNSQCPALYIDSVIAVRRCRYFSSLRIPAIRPESLPPAFNMNNISNFLRSDTTWQQECVMISLKLSRDIFIRSNEVNRMAKILIVEDEKSINDLVKFNLELVGHACSQVFDGESGLKEALKFKYDLIILDVMLPKFSGFEIMEYIEETPVIFVTAKSAAQDRIKGLRLGADDYITKPFDMIELTERVKAVLRRTKADSKDFEFDDIRIEFDNRRVYKAGKEVVLKPKEFDLLEALVNHRNLALSREKLLRLVWEFDYEGDTRTVDVHIQRIRQKLGISDRIQTVYKTGYRFEI